MAACYDAASRGLAVSGDREGQPSLRLVQGEFSERIAANLENLLAGKPRDDLSVANDTSPREAMEAFSREPQPTG